MIGWFLIQKQFVKPAGKATAEFPDPEDRPMLNIIEVLDPKVPDNVAFDGALTVSQPENMPAGDHTGRVARIAMVGYKHSKFSTTFRTQIVGWGGKVDIASAIAAGDTTAAPAKK